jgi:hypothetical protein
MQRGRRKAPPPVASPSDAHAVPGHDRATAPAATLARRGGAGRLGDLRLARRRARARRDGTRSVLDLPATLQRGVHPDGFARPDADRRDTARLHRPRRGGRVPDEAVQHRRRGPDVHGGDHGRRRGSLSRRARQPVPVRDRGHGGGRLLRWHGLGPDPRHPARLLPDERDPHFPPAQLRRGPRPHLPDLRERVVLAPDEGLQRHRLPDRQAAAAFRRLAGVLSERSGRHHAPARGRPRRARRRPPLVPVHADALRLRGASARRLRPGGPLRGHPRAAKDPRRDGALGRHRRPRRREPGRRLPARARRRPERPPEAGLRLHGHRRRGARALQPVRGRRDRLPDRRASERRRGTAGAGLPIGPRGRDPGHHPLLRAGRRAAHPLPHPPAKRSAPERVPEAA